jgi:heterodisulfide reductase subunit C
MTVKTPYREAIDVLVDEGGETLQLCYQCASRTGSYPRGVRLIDVVKAIRRTVMELGVGKSPSSLRVALTSIVGVGNPIGEVKESPSNNILVG